MQLSFKKKVYIPLKSHCLLPPKFELKTSEFFNFPHLFGDRSVPRGPTYTHKQGFTWFSNLPLCVEWGLPTHAINPGECAHALTMTATVLLLWNSIVSSKGRYLFTFSSSGSNFLVISLFIISSSLASANSFIIRKIDSNAKCIIFIIFFN